MSLTQGEAPIAGPRGPEARRRSRFQSTLGFVILIGTFALLFSFATVIVTSLFIGQQRERMVREVAKDLRSLSIMLSSHVEQTLRSIDLVHEAMAQLATGSGIGTSDDFRSRMADVFVHLKLADMVHSLVYVDAVGVVDARGELINSSRRWPVNVISVADRDYFKTMRENPRLKTHVHGPYRSRTTGESIINVARALRGPSGELLGMFLAAIKVSYFEQFFASIQAGDDVAIHLLHKDGVLLARYPSNPEIIGKNFSNHPLLRDADRPFDGFPRLLPAFDGGEDRFAITNTLDHIPFRIAVTQKGSAAMAGWRRTAMMIGLTGLLAGCAIALALGFVGYQFWVRSQSSQRTIRQQRRHIEIALANMSQGVCLFGGNGRLVFHNSRFLNLLGLTPEMIKAKCTFSDLMGAASEKGRLNVRACDEVTAILAEIESGSQANRLIETRDGRLLQATFRPAQADGWLMAVEDVTDLTSRLSEMDLTRQFLDCIIDHVPIAIFVKEVETGQYVLINRATESLWGKQRAEIVGKTAAELFPPDHATDIRLDDLKAIQSGETVQIGEHTIDAGDKKRVTTGIKIAVRGQDGKPQYVISVVEDITEKRAIAAQLHQAQKMEAVGRLTGGLAHDFNNLLMIIIGNLDLALEELEKDGSAAAGVSTALGASLRGAELTEQLLAFSRKQPLKPERVNLNAALANSVKLLTRTLGQNITIEARLDDEVWPAFLDQTQLETALLNLAINARDAMPDGGLLIIQASNARVEPGDSVCDNGLMPGDYAVVQVTDTGTGIPADVLPRIFDPFFTTKPRGQGTGLGLSMVYGYITQSGGHISVATEIGGGTTFRLYLPRAIVEPAETVSLVPSTDAAEECIGGETILVVDDNVDVRQTACAQLRNLGYQVLEAKDTTAALGFLDSEIKVDLLLTDVIMPGVMDGKELAKRARQKRPHLKVLFMSGYPDEHLDEQTQAGGGDAWLRKPYRKQQLAEAIRQMLWRDGAPARV